MDKKPRVLVAEKIAASAITLLEEGGVEVRVQTGLSREELLGAVAEVDALVVRSQTRVDRELLSAGRRLRVVGRAGIGVDNIDVEAATRLGILVVNAPQSNVVSAAEHTLGLLLALARKITLADRSLRSGRWERERFEGVELNGKVMGIVGLGRVGTLVAQRASAFGMRIIAYDPYVPEARAARLGIRLLPLEQVLREADVVSVHVPKTPETVGLLGERELSLMKPGALLVNTARGGIVDEEALYRALREGRIGGAALDVFAREPCTSSPLFELENVVVTPHLGASTREAQDKAGRAVAEQVLLALKGEFVPYAVNVEAASELPETLKAFLGLAERLGRVFTALAGSRVEQVEVEYHGEVAAQDTRVLTVAALKGILAPVVEEPVTFVNAPVIARERGLAVREARSAESRDYVSLMVLRGLTQAGEVDVAGTVVGPGRRERFVRILGFEMDMSPARYMVFFRYEDRPGVIGKVGSILGREGINIAFMQVGRMDRGGDALMGLTVDSPIPPEVLEEIVEAVGMKDARAVTLEGLPA